MNDDKITETAAEAEARARAEDSLAPYERRLIEAIRRIMPGYRFEFSHFAKQPLSKEWGRP